MLPTLRDLHHPLWPRRRHRPPRRRRRPAAAAVLALALTVPAGCGSEGTTDGPGAADDGPRVADPRFDGDFLITAVEVDGGAVTPIQGPRMTIEARFGTLTVEPGCNIHYGSFTLDEDGAASFTVTGGSDLDCGDLAPQEEAILTALAGATSWTGVDGGFRFDGPATSLTATGPAGDLER